MPIVGFSRSDQKALARNGALILVEVHLSQAARVKREKDGRKIPVEKAEALIDTGAGITCVDDGIAKRLELVPRDRITVHTAGGVCQQLLYDATLHIPHLRIRQELPILGSSIASQSHHVLIGRDILSLGTLVYSGWKGGFEFCV